MLTPGVKIEDLSIDDIIHTAPEELGNTRRPLGPQRSQPTVKEAQEKAAIDAIIARGKQAAPTTDISSEVAAQRAAEREELDKLNPATSKPYTFMDRALAAAGDWMGSTIMQALEDDDPAYDPEWDRDYAKNHVELEETARSPEEVSERRASRSKADYQIIVSRQFERAQRNGIIDSNGTGWMFRLFLGPVGLFLGIIFMTAMYWLAFIRNRGGRSGSPAGDSSS
jgi:hypothetical protein